MARNVLQQSILAYVAQQRLAGSLGCPAGAIQANVGRPRPTVNRALVDLTNTGCLVRAGAGRAVIYRLPQASAEKGELKGGLGLLWGSDAQLLLQQLSAPLGSRKPVTYQRSFVGDYKPNESSLLPQELARQLFQAGKSKDQQPAGTYARKVLEQLLIDLSWYSSRLEGNRKSMLDTRELFKKGRSESDDLDSTMLLNHKDAIEFIVDAVPTEGITVPVVRNVQGLLMRDLLDDPADLGAIRNKIVNIQDTVYVPSQVPGLLEEMLVHIVEKVRHIRNPVEASFFLWVNLAYLQPFVDGNKRTSRLAANMPLMLANCAPLSFLDVEQQDYALAMLGVYERLDTRLATELFEWTYRRSIDKYQVVVESLGGPDPRRVRYREQLGEAVRQVVYFGTCFDKAVESHALPEVDMQAFQSMLSLELQHLEPYNCARYRLPIAKTAEWIAKGRPQ
ncbi:MAG: Fic family protein [Limnobacter sp.]|nr:Fic family protein [Limnobacter sp.]